LSFGCCWPQGDDGPHRLARPPLRARRRSTSSRDVSAGEGRRPFARRRPPESTMCLSSGASNGVPARKPRFRHDPADRMRDLPANASRLLPVRTRPFKGRKTQFSELATLENLSYRALESQTHRLCREGEHPRTAVDQVAIDALRSAQQTAVATWGLFYARSGSASVRQAVTISGTSSMIRCSM